MAVDGRIPTDEIPQADKLEVVLETLRAVSLGATSYQQIAVRIGKVERQARYYRNAAEILGLLSREAKNVSTLTEVGATALSANATDSAVLQAAILSARIFQRVLIFVASKPNGVSHPELVAFLELVSEPTEASMMTRRKSTVVSWLRDSKLIREDDGKFVVAISSFNVPAIISVSTPSEPLLPTKGELKEYQDVIKSFGLAKKVIASFVDAASLERAQNAHQRLVNLVAARVRELNVLPTSNGYIDLAANIDGVPTIFEMKSNNPKNSKSQLRKGVSQLYEYRYLQNAPEAKLVLVLEGPLPSKHQWMGAYLEADRGIALLWDGNDELNGSAESKALIGL